MLIPADKPSFSLKRVFATLNCYICVMAALPHNKCAICHEKTSHGNVALSGCQHIFHRDCIATWMQVHLHWLSLCSLHTVCQCEIPLLQISSTCPLCKQHVHSLTCCASGKTELVESKQQGAEEDILEDVGCSFCGSNDPALDEWALLCDRCNGCCHTFCLGLGMKVPDGEWFCPQCVVELNVDQLSPTSTNTVEQSVTEEKESDLDTVVTSSASDSDDGGFSCQVCFQSFSNRWNMNRHSRVHEQEPVVHVCKYCPFSATRSDSMARHYRRRHQILEQGQ